MPSTYRPRVIEETDAFITFDVSQGGVVEFPDGSLMAVPPNVTQVSVDRRDGRLQSKPWARDEGLAEIHRLTGIGSGTRHIPKKRTPVLVSEMCADQYIGHVCMLREGHDLPHQDKVTAEKWYGRPGSDCAAQYRGDFFIRCHRERGHDGAHSTDRQKPVDGELWL